MRSQIPDIVYILTKSNYIHALTNPDNYTSQSQVRPCAHKLQMFTTPQGQVSSSAHKFPMFTTSQSQIMHMRSQIPTVYNLTKSSQAYALKKSRWLQSHNVKLAHALTNSNCSQSHKVKLGPCNTNIRVALHNLTTSSLAPVLTNLRLCIRHTMLSDLFLGEILGAVYLLTPHLVGENNVFLHCQIALYINIYK
jgi:hypothetical protein